MSAYLTTLTGVTFMNESKNDNQSNFSKFNGNADKVKAGANQSNDKTDAPKPDNEQPKNDETKPK